MAVSGAENPWTSNDLLLGVKLGDPRSGVVIARRCGLLGPQVRQCEERVAQSSSIQIIHALQEITKLNQALQQVEFELHRHLLDKESKDLMHLDVLEKRVKSVASLLNHFTAVLDSKEHILSRLQSCSTHNSLQVEAPYHKHLLDIFHSVSPALSDLTTNTNRIASAKSVDLTNMKGKMATAVQSLVECRDMYQSCQQLHTHHNSTHRTT